MKFIKFLNIALVALLAINPVIGAELSSEEKLEAAEKSFLKAFEEISGKGGVIDSTPSISLDKIENSVDSISFTGKNVAEQALKHWQDKDEKGFNQLLWEDATWGDPDQSGLGKEALAIEKNRLKIIAKQFLIKENLEENMQPVLAKIKHGKNKLTHIKKRLNSAKDDFFLFVQFGENQPEEILLLGLQKIRGIYKVSYLEF